MAERVGFEPTVPFGTTVFETVTINLALPPLREPQTQHQGQAPERARMRFKVNYFIMPDDVLFVGDLGSTGPNHWKPHRGTV